jgi:signal peptidase I
MSETNPTAKPARHWSKPIIEIAAAFLIVMAAKGALAEPFYVPSGSMEPTLLIGDALVASKYPYGYSSASIPLNMALPSTPRLFGSLPDRGDVVVFRWPGDKSQVWVKRVVGLPGDHIQMRHGRLWINGQATALRDDGMGRAEGICS